MPRGEPERILVIDDDAAIRQTLTQRLSRQEGCRCLIARNAGEAFKRLQEETVSVALIDIHLPDRSGLQVLEEITSAHPDTVAIVVTGSQDLDTAIAALRGGAFDYLVKPVNLDELALRVERALEKRRMGLELKQWQQSLERKVEEQTAEIQRKNEELAARYEGIKNDLHESVKLGMGLVELYDKKMGAHLRRVAQICRGVALKLRMPLEEIGDVELAALFHDIGLIGVPRQLLRTPFSQMNPKEIGLIRRHPATGAERLMTIEAFQKAAVYVRAHHERINGTGYPDGLKIGEVPLGAQIVSICDAYDELLHSVYGTVEMALPAVLEHLQKQAGKRYEREVANTFFGVIQEATLVEVDVNLLELGPDMILARDVLSHSGQLVAKKDTVLTQALVREIHEHHMADPILGKIAVLKAKGK